MRRDERRKELLGGPNMSGEKPKHDRSGDPQAKCGRKEQCNCQVHIESPLTIDVTKAILKQHAEERAEDQRHSKKQLFWTQVAAGLVLAYTLLTGLQTWQTRSIVKTAQDTYDATDRPYVGVAGTEIMFVGEKNKILGEGNIHLDEVRSFEYSVNIKNYGVVPAEKFSARMDVRLDGKPAEDRGIADVPGEIFPGQVQSIAGLVPPIVYAPMAKGTSVMQMNVYVKYSYAGKTYADCERAQYSPDLGRFFNLGPKCGDPWATK